MKAFTRLAHRPAAAAVAAGILTIATVLAGACGAAHAAPSSVTVRRFGTLPDGRTASLYTLTNRRGAQAQITNYGGIVTSLKVPNRRGQLGDVVLGYDNLSDYLRDNPFFGAVAGRYANRIARGRFTLDGKTYTLAKNNGPNHLHGGRRGFDKVLWTATPFNNRNGAGVRLRYMSKNGEEGYPGNLWVRMTYTLTNDNALRVDYSAVTDRATVVNLTHHSYFNLNDAGRSNILNHRLQLFASRFTPVDPTLIPTGELRPVRGTPFDFLRPTPIGARINQNNEQLRRGKGYDHNFVLNGRRGQLRLAARAYAPRSGRVMTVYTTEPGMQLYTGNFLNGQQVGKGEVPYRLRSGFCLEAQHFPDSPNKPAFPSTVLRPGQVYRQTTIYKFSTR